MRFKVFIFWFSLLFSLSGQANESFYLPLESGEEVSVNVFPATFEDAEQPLLIWFSEGYASRKPFKQLISDFNDIGYEVWQVDLLESYFIQRTPTNIRSLNGEGVAEVLAHASTLERDFIPISTGRMSLVLLRGSRLWQLQQKPENGIGNLKQLISFFPNLFDAPKKAGDAPTLFPIVSATSLPVTLVQPIEGTYKWKLPQIIDALETNNSQVAIASVPDARDWYFLRREPSELEKQQGQQIPEQMDLWLKAGQVASNANFKPAESLLKREATISLKGLVKIEPRQAPNFVLTDTFQQTINLQQKQGKVILLNFWASWCPPCVKETPSMNRLAESYKPEQFEIVSVNFKESPKTISDFLKKVKVDFPVLIDQGGRVSNQYEIFAFPSSFILDKDGNLQYSVNAAIEWDDPQIKTVIDAMIK